MGIFTLLYDASRSCWMGPEGGLDTIEEMCKNALKVNVSCALRAEWLTVFLCVLVAQAGYRHLDTVCVYFVVTFASISWSDA